MSAPPDVACLIAGSAYLYPKYPKIIKPTITIIAVKGPLELSCDWGLFITVAIFNSPPSKIKTLPPKNNEESSKKS